MNRKVAWGLGFVAFLAVLAASWFALQKKYDMDIAPESYSFVDRFERDGVPAIAVPAVAKDGVLSGVLKLDEVKEPIVIVNFWASWCNPCVEEFPSMLKLVEALDGKVAIVAVSQLGLTGITDIGIGYEFQFNFFSRRNSVAEDE